MDEALSGMGLGKSRCRPNHETGHVKRLQGNLTPLSVFMAWRITKTVPVTISANRGMMDSLIFSSIGLYTVVLYIFGRKTTMAQCIFNRKREGGRSIAIYHCSIKIISRGKGKSAVAAAAYRAGETITNEYDGITHDYTRKGGVVHTEILLSDNAPAEYSDRAVLWNAESLDEHIRHSGNYKGYRGHKVQYEKLYAQYQTIKKSGGFGAERKAQKALDTTNEYYETYRNEITMYDNAEKYLRDVLQKHFDPKKLPPITKWKAERDKLTAERNKLNQRYISLKDEVKEAEKIRKSVDTIMREENRRTQPKRAHDMEL